MPKTFVVEKSIIMDNEIINQSVRALSSPESLENLLPDAREGCQPLPSSELMQEAIDVARSILFPGYFGHSKVTQENVAYFIGVSLERFASLLKKQGICEDNIGRLIAQLPEIRKMLAMDVEAAYNGDPAATSYEEIICCYPVIRALINYRMAHALYELGVPLIPRVMTEMAHSETGIDIHPAAKIGHHFTIDHGTGVVIGATSIIGNNVKLYQGVTLGALSFPLDDNGNPIKGIARHPILEDDIIVYSNATILGRITIGKGSVIGANQWITQDVAPQSKIVNKQ